MSESAEHRAAADLLARLVQCPSVNPIDGVPDEQHGEGRMAALLKDLLEPWGATVEVQEVLPGRPNVLAKFRGADSTRSLMFEAHSDTVSVDGMTTPPFGGKVEEGRLYGRGACDDKGSLAAMLIGIRRYLDAGAPPPVDVWLVSTCDEEIGAAGARALRIRPDLAIVGEPTELKIFSAHKGALRWRVTTRGRTAHSATPERGANAIVAMGRIIDRLTGPFAAALAARPHPRLGAPTFSIGTIRGGTQLNVVPDRCEIGIDRRLVPGETAAAATAELREALAVLGVEIEELNQYPAFEQPEDSAVARIAAAGCREAFGEAVFGVAPWCSNAGIFKAAGIPCVLFGPGSTAQAHAPDEFIDLDQVVRAARAYAAMIEAAGRL